MIHVIYVMNQKMYNNTNIIKYYKDEDEEQEQQEREGRIIDDDNLEIISPSQALRKDIGNI